MDWQKVGKLRRPQQVGSSFAMWVTATWGSNEAVKKAAFAGGCHVDISSLCSSEL